MAVSVCQVFPVGAGFGLPPRTLAVGSGGKDGMNADSGIWLSLPVPVILVDAEDRIRAVNPAGEAFLHASSRGVAHVPLWSFLTVDARVREAFANARIDEVPLVASDVEITAGRNSSMACDLRTAPLAGEAGGIVLAVWPRDFGGGMPQGHVVRSMAKSVIGMVRMLVHEIKNPLAGIAGAAQLMSMGGGRRDRELTDLIVAETHRIVKLLDQVGQFGDMSPPAMQRINIHDVLERARRSAALGFGANMTIREDYDPSLPLAYGDPDQLLQVVLNLLKNASEAAGPLGGTITLRSHYDFSSRLRRTDGPEKSLPLQVEVADDGPGLPAAIRDDVFDPFVSGRVNGTGLGLALVSKIISDHDAAITVSSVPGRTVFRLSLPCAPNRLPEPAGEGTS